ncbi:MAG TPA: class II histone deacetylase [Thermomicrobiales bacterium]|nr:class II histone deacetylase [Thermomicrobiales bacterium]
MSSSRSAYVWDSAFLKHDTGESSLQLPDGTVMDPVEHYSNNRVTNRTAQLIRGSGLQRQLISISTRPASLEEIQYAHTIGYIDKVRQMTAAGGGMLDDQTRVSPGSWDAALLAAGGALELTDAVLDGRARNGYGLLRPIGHHAMPAQGMGFCVFNNVVIATRHVQRHRGIGRVAIVDWDVHHGNGAQTAFWDDSSVLFISLHQDDWYPGGWGKLTDVGGEEALGTTVNIPLPAGTGNRGYDLAFERVVEPILRQFEPELLFISAGQDASLADPLGRMFVTTKGFRMMAERLRLVADDVCQGRVIGFQEGGYSASYTPYCTLAVVEGITGIATGVGEPWTGSSEHARAERAFGDEQVTAIDAALEIQSSYWQI